MKRVIVSNISKKFKIGFKKHQTALSRFVSVFSGKESKKSIWALKDVSFSVNVGEIIGIIGKNGSGKSTLLRVIAGIYKADEGTIQNQGRVISLISLSAGFKQRLTVRDNIYLCCSFLGMHSRFIRHKFNSIIEFAGLNNYVETKMYQLSFGMVHRLAIAIAFECDPDILLIDEYLVVGDNEFIGKHINKLKKLIEKGTTVILVSHYRPLIEKLCSKVILLEQGRVVAYNKTEKILQEYPFILAE